ncbi:flagellar brake protein [Enterovibrio sp. ZSDZ35]|uniref:Flagellar brake protein n=1 Tax=Enterovibrio qingdaonensis TaxID=2899818 RepID=A0ABT5QH14_9GAMM|nr:PilZ domain-containing protein [Enterovibrio sp. ZSDZ35]MDD1780261.1 flagellar brake protein [Enterovibrio sp. ZSDZ35]
MIITDTLTPAAFLPTIAVGSALSFELKYKDKISAFSGPSKLIGFRDKKYILLETPSDPELSKLLNDPSGLQVVVKGLNCSRFGEIFVFKTHILSVMHRPEKMLAVALPDVVNIHRMRKFARYTISRIVQLEIDGRNTLAKLADFSLGGCAIRTAANLFVDQGEVLRVVINSLFHEPVCFDGVVASVSSHGEGIQLGIQFNETATDALKNTLGRLIVQADHISEATASVTTSSTTETAASVGA